MNLKKKIIYWYLLLLPFIDLLTSLTTRFTNYSVTIGQIVKGLTIVFLIIYVIFISKSKYKKISIIYYMILFAFGLMYLISKVTVINSEFIVVETAYILRYFYFPIVLIGAINIFDDYQFDIGSLKNIIMVTALIYSSLIIIPCLTGTSFYSYYDYKNFKGYVGWFYAANEISAILTILSISMYYFMDVTKNIKILLIIPIALSLSLLGTKVAFLGMLVVSIICIIVFLMKNKKNAIFLSLISVCIIVTMALLSPASSNFKNVIANFLDGEYINNSNDFFSLGVNTVEKLPSKEENEIIEEDSVEIFYKYNNMSDIIKNEKLSKIITIMFNGRDGQFLKNYSVYSEGKLSDKLFGLGWYNRTDISSKDKLIEIDYLDIWMHYGVIGFIVYFIPLFYFIVYLFKNKRNITLETFLYILMLLVVFGIAMFAGHVFSAPSASIYVIIIIVMIIKNIELKEVNI